MEFNDKLIKKYFEYNEVNQAKAFLKEKSIAVNAINIDFLDIENVSDVTKILNNIIDTLPDDTILSLANRCIMMSNIDACRDILLNVPAAYGEDVSILTIDITASFDMNLMHYCIGKDIEPNQSYFYIHQCKNTKFFNCIYDTLMNRNLRGYIGSKNGNMYIRLYPIKKVEYLLELVKLINQYY